MIVQIASTFDAAACAKIANKADRTQT